MIPCKDCLILPICRNKKHVKCNLLHKWWANARRLDTKDNVNVELWESVAVYMREVEEIHCEDSHVRPYIIYNWSLIAKKVRKKNESRLNHHSLEVS